MKAIFVVASIAIVSVCNVVWAQAYFDAITNNDLESLQNLITQGVDIEQRDAAGATPLMIAAERSQLAMVEALLAAGADINAQMSGTVQGSAVMHLAAKYANLETIHLLLQHEPRLERTLLSLAYSGRNDADAVEIVRLLLDAGAPIDEVGHFYDVMDDRAIIDYFACLPSVADADYNNSSHTCQGTAAEVLLAAFNASHSRNLSREDSLAFAAMFAGPQLVQHLIDSGLDPNAPIVRTEGNTKNPRAMTTALELALYKHNTAAATVLLANGAAIEEVHPTILQRAAFDASLQPLLQQAGLNTQALQEAFRVAHAPCAQASMGVSMEASTQASSAQAMVSFIFDDGDKKDRDLIRYIFAPRQQVGTVALVSNFVGKQHHTTIEDVQAWVAMGWEVASHSVHHRDQATLSAQDLQASLRQSKDMLEAMGFTADTFVYPYGSYTPTVSAHVRDVYTAAFAGGYKLNGRGAKPSELQRFNISVKHSYKDYIRILERAIREEKWLIWTVHPAYDTGWQQQEYMAELLDELCSRGVPVVTVSEGLARLGDLAR